MRTLAPTDLPNAWQAKRRIVLKTFGSLGDLHPYIAIALGLQARGHEAVIATTSHYRQRVESRGLGFHAVRPEGPDCAERALGIGQRLRQEDGVSSACDALEELFCGVELVVTLAGSISPDPAVGSDEPVRLN